MENKLNIAEHFESVQGEGISIGVPAYFIRLKGCNFSCGFSAKAITALSKEVNAIEGYIPGGNIVGDLHEEGKATWTCDSASVWLKGKQTPFEDLIKEWERLDILHLIKNGTIHIIWTGGEPTIPQHQKSIVQFIDFLNAPDSYHEIETNGSIPLSKELSKRLHQINCSVKLKNSGMKAEKRINADALKSIINHPNHSFKFVISTEDDIKEILMDFIEPHGINTKNICMMPGLDSQENYFERVNFCLEMGVKYRIRALTRMHIAAWNTLTGV